MKCRKIIPLLLAVMLLTACRNGEPDASFIEPVSSVVSSESSQSVSVVEASMEESESVTEPDATEIYTSIMEAEYLDAETAYEQIQGIESEDSRIQGLIENMTWLHQCSGRFVHEAKTGDKQYSADVSFYLSDGCMYCNVNYTNYMGELEPGILDYCNEEDYIYETHTVGQYFSNAHDFEIKLGVELLSISWAGNEFVLVRGDGQEDLSTPFEETSLYETLEGIVTNCFEQCDYAITYDDTGLYITDCVNIYVSDPFGNGKIREKLDSKDAAFIDSWNSFCTSLEELSNNIYTIASVGRGPQHCSFYIVDKIQPDGEYSRSEYVFRADDGIISYNYADTISLGTSSASSSSANTATSTSSATLGERNALSRANDYLDVIPFSYTGLIDQLEYEGYSYSEAVYGADHCGADWYEQAALKAADYLDLMAFSRQGLIDQLEYEGFTYDQALYGVKQNGY